MPQILLEGLFQVLENARNVYRCDTSRSEKHNLHLHSGRGIRQRPPEWDRIVVEADFQLPSEFSEAVFDAIRVFDEP